MDIFEKLINNSTVSRIDEELWKDNEYQNIQNGMQQIMEELESLQLTKAQTKVVDKVLSCYNSNSARYGEIAYKRGFLDCVELFKNIKLI